MIFLVLLLCFVAWVGIDGIDRAIGNRKRLQQRRINRAIGPVILSRTVSAPMPVHEPWRAVVDR